MKKDASGFAESVIAFPARMAFSQAGGPFWDSVMQAVYAAFCRLSIALFKKLCS
jgi:hypothetical protein